MRALTFLEHRIKELENIEHGETVSSGLMERKITSFYSQPFKPEMITELFVGWERKVTKVEYAMPSEKFEYYTGVAFIPPVTLNDFISDCQRAGIELTWKPKIIKRHFE